MLYLVLQSTYTVRLRAEQVESNIGFILQSPSQSQADGAVHTQRIFAVGYFHRYLLKNNARRLCLTLRR